MCERGLMLFLQVREMMHARHVETQDAKTLGADLGLGFGRRHALWWFLERSQTS